MSAEKTTKAEDQEMLLLSEEERKWYYSGLPSRARLVARSNAATIKWQRRVEDEHPVLKHLGRVGQHPIVDKSETTSLVQDVVAILNASLKGWNCIDVLRLGYSRSDHENPVILWIGVLPNSTSSELGMNVVLQCRATLERHGLDDVQCEIRETVVQLAASSTARNQSTVKNLDVHGDEVTPGGFHVPGFTDTIGQCVAMEDNPTREATLGCFVALAKEPNTPCEKYAVISRHLVFAKDDNNNNEYRHHNSSRMKHVIMPGDCFLKEAQEKVTVVMECWTRRLTHLLQHQSVPGQQRDVQAVQSARQEIAKSKRFHDHLVSISEPETRRIGYVKYSPPRQVNVQTGNMQDFAIVKLNQDRFQARLDDLSNMVYIADKPGLCALNEDLGWNPYVFPRDIPVLRLQGVVPVANLTPPWTECGRETLMGETVLRVCKRGRTTGSTWGEVNEFMSVARTAVNSEMVISRHLAVLGFHKTPFSDTGDSGSAIFTPDGKMVAMLDAGLGAGDEDPLTDEGLVQDLTYGTPLASILEDIRRAGYATAHLC
ncbi:hypothetical protein CONLIGDRAFT_606949 [Coniochaeta ligniaria NRRL 30616]|uniref:Uncharacterized protein n=1 Tax=Coniochaeta ligniaria NRRL 30616 TaxID=1408157 RepID=A0A1J7I4T9_9PEZI|nr:hypothetical protein CONLIGDRAFT_606949 [Coniochaeta ligniaria NRRL 30616]